MSNFDKGTTSESRLAFLGDYAPAIYQYHWPKLLERSSHLEYAALAKIIRPDTKHMIQCFIQDRKAFGFKKTKKQARRILRVLHDGGTVDIRQDDFGADSVEFNRLNGCLFPDWSAFPVFADLVLDIYESDWGNKARQSRHTELTLEAISFFYSQSMDWFAHLLFEIGICEIIQFGCKIQWDPPGFCVDNDGTQVFSLCVPPYGEQLKSSIYSPRQKRSSTKQWNDLLSSSEKHVLFFLASIDWEEIYRIDFSRQWEMSFLK